MLNNIDIKKLYDTGGKCKGLSALPSILKLGGACLILSVANFVFVAFIIGTRSKLN